MRRARLWMAAAALAFACASVALAVRTLAPRTAATFASETAWLDRPAPTPRHAVHVSSASAFARAVRNARAGETILVRGPVRVAGEFTGFDRAIPGGVVDVVLGPGVAFTGGKGADLPAVLLRGSSGWRIWGGTITNPGGDGLLVYAMPGPLTWTGFSVHDTANTCVSVYPVGGSISGLTLAGVTGTAHPNLALDPHAEKGTGIHAWNIADAGGGVVRDSTFAADVVDQATGAAVEIDTSQIGPNVTVYARARHLGFAVPGTSWTGDAHRQVAGNVVQLWGGTPPGNLDIRYAEGDDIQGRVLDTTGVEQGADLSRVRVDTGRVGGPVLLDPRLDGTAAFAAADGLQLGDVQGSVTTAAPSSRAARP